MARVGLTLYLMVAAAAGPWLCCCTVGHLFALCPAPQQKPSAGHRCCGHHEAGRGHPNTTPSATPGRPSPAPHGSCPCKENQPAPLVSTVPAPSSGAEQERILLPRHSVEAGRLLLPAICLASHTQGQSLWGSMTCPFRDSRDILRALHILRC